MRMNTATNNTKRRDPMASTIRARVKGGLLEPLETLNLPEGKEVTVTVLDVPSTRDVDAFHRSAGGWKGLIDAEELKRNIYADRLISTRPEPCLSR
jgi:predicted DNA-binding antitoxin AbrB/MazE fold protein